MTGALTRAQTDGAWTLAYDHNGSTVTDNCAQPASIRRDFDPANKFQGVHACLIPTGAHQGHVLVWNHLHYETGNYLQQKRVIHYSIVDPTPMHPGPYPPLCYNHIGCFIPLGKGDLFCVGQAWNAEGHLVVAGGTTIHPTGTQAWGGAQLVYVWEPPTGIGAPGKWTAPKLGPVQDYLVKHRWYPSVVALCPDVPPNQGQDRMLILGGTHRDSNGNFVVENTYECWEEAANPEGKLQSINQTRFWNGPQGNANYVLRDYPRAHTLSSNKVATAGFVSGCGRVLHDPTNAGMWFTNNLNWWMSAWNLPNGAHWRVYGSSVLFPISVAGGMKDQIVAIGGVNTTSDIVMETVEICDANAASPAWAGLASMTHRRQVLNSVLLPDSSVLVVGGEKDFTGLCCSDEPALVPELYAAGGWMPLAPSPIIRDYHSCALLLPDASVFVCGGESRHHNKAGGTCPVKGPAHGNPADYQIFLPPYLTLGNTRPAILNAPTPHWIWPYQTTQNLISAALPLGVSISKITLLRAGAVTHHADTNQRCVELNFQVVGETPEGDQAIDVIVPSRATNLLPRGFYLLFLVTNQGTPSIAAWVKIQ